MASRLTFVSRVFALAVTAPTLLGSAGAFAQDYGPYRVQGPAKPGRAWHENYCGERESVRAPDIMSYDRKTQSEVLVGSGTGQSTQVTGINRTTGTAYSVKGDLAGPETTNFCTANAETGSAYSVQAQGAGTIVRGLDGQTHRSFEVAQGPDGHGPDFKSRDPASGRSVAVVTGPNGVPVIREFGPHALACTRLRLGGGVKADINDIGVGAKGGVQLNLGDC